VRLAVLMQHSRNLEPPPDFTLQPRENGLLLTFPEGWFDERPLTFADLRNEQDYLAKQNFVLELAGG